MEGGTGTSITVGRLFQLNITVTTTDDDRETALRNCARVKSPLLPWSPGSRSQSSASSSAKTASTYSRSRPVRRLLPLLAGAVSPPRITPVLYRTTSWSTLWRGAMLAVANLEVGSERYRNALISWARPLPGSSHFTHPAIIPSDLTAELAGRRRFLSGAVTAT